MFIDHIVKHIRQNNTEPVKVLDLCAAPGGKSTLLNSAIGPNDLLVANEIIKTRVPILTDNLNRWGQSNVIVSNNDPKDFGRLKSFFDIILVDAPCSATGTFRRHPEVVWHRSTADIAGRVALQRELLGAAWKLLKPGGTLVYCVCSLEPEEGEAQADWALANLPGIRPEPVPPARLAPLTDAVTAAGQLRTHPAMVVPGTAAGTLDGFFAARFRRT